MWNKERSIEIKKIKKTQTDWADVRTVFSESERAAFFHSTMEIHEKGQLWRNYKYIYIYIYESRLA